MTCSVCVAEGSRTTQVFLPGFLVDCSTPLHEVSGVKVPRPASPFITHETSMLLEGMAVAVSRGTCMDEVIDSSIWCDGE